MLIKVNSAGPYGLDGRGISVEVDIMRRGLPRFDIIGLPSKAVDESRHRIRTAFVNLGLGFPHDKTIVVNLAPADLPKQGSFYDFPISVGIMCLENGLSLPERSLFFGEISLDGGLRHVRGAFLLGLYSREKNFTSVFVPRSNSNEVAAVPEVKVYPLDDLLQLYNHLIGKETLTFYERREEVSDHDNFEGAVDFNDVIGQEKTKRGLEVAAAGGHNFFMQGPPGAGKTMLSKAFQSILPPLTQEESLEVTKIYSAAGHIPPEGSLITRPPFRNPHHSISYAGMVGGGAIPRPGEISLAHRGVLFMDEFPEFQRPVLEMLRQPLEEGSIRIARVNGSFSFPCRFILLAASNPCPCGFFGSTDIPCSCSPGKILNYNRKLSGPVLDRIDLISSVDPVDKTKLLYTNEKERSESSSAIRGRVIKARSVQLDRLVKDKIFCNADMPNKLVRRYCSLDSEEEQFLNKAVSVFSLSARSYFKVLKVSRTIADLEESFSIKESHIAEALQYRRRF